MELNFRTCSLSDIELLSKLSKKTFYETFADENNPNTMATYLESSFNKEQLQNEVSNPNSLFLFLYSDNKLAGYLKTNVKAAQTEYQEENGLEIERIYLLKEFQGQGLGSVLLEKAFSIANDQNKEYVWLGVWERNENAISFYQHKGFIKIGSHDFFIGEEKQKDYIMRKNL